MVESDVDGALTQLTVSRSIVGPGGQFTVTYTVRNTRDTAVRLSGGCSPIALGTVCRGEESVAFEGSGTGCWTLETHYDIPAGGSHETIWLVKAKVVRWDGGLEYAPATRGEYRFRVEPVINSIEGVKKRLPALEANFQVK